MSSLSGLPTKLCNNNALTHGGTSEKLILPNELREDFEALLQGLQAEYQPETTQQHLFIEQLAMGHWILWRRQRACYTIETGTYNVESHPSRWVEEDHRRLILAERYKTAAERALKRALQNAESIRTQRLSEQDRIERHNRWRAEQDLREARQKMNEEKQKAATARQAALVKAAEPATTVKPVPTSPSPAEPSALATRSSQSDLDHPLCEPFRFAKNALSSPCTSEQPAK